MFAFVIFSLALLFSTHINGMDEAATITCRQEPSEDITVENFKHLLRYLPEKGLNDKTYYPLVLPHKVTTTLVRNKTLKSTITYGAIRGLNPGLPKKAPNGIDLEALAWVSLVCNAAGKQSNECIFLGENGVHFVGIVDKGNFKLHIYPQSRD